MQVAAEIAAPLSQAKKITMVADASGELGASRLTGEVLQIVQSVPTLVKNMTGVDVTTQMGGSAARMVTTAGGGVGGHGSRVRKKTAAEYIVDWSYQRKLVSSRLAPSRRCARTEGEEDLYTTYYTV